MIGAQQSTDDLLSQVRPITGPEAVPPPDDSGGWVIWLAVVIAAIIGIVVWRRFRRPLSGSPIFEIQHALNRLPTTPSAEALATFDLICRRWLSEVHQVDGEHETGRALLRQLPQSVQEEWSLVFAQLEPGRFSKHPLTATQWLDLINKVRTMIAADIAGSVAQ